MSGKHVLKYKKLNHEKEKNESGYFMATFIFKIKKNLKINNCPL